MRVREIVLRQIPAATTDRRILDCLCIVGLLLSCYIAIMGSLQIVI